MPRGRPKKVEEDIVKPAKQVTKKSTSKTMPKAETKSIKNEFAYNEKHGKWIAQENPLTGAVRYKCSSCGSLSLVTTQKCCVCRSINQ